MRKQKILSLLFVLFLSGGIFHSCQESDDEFLSKVVTESDFQLSDADKHLQNVVSHINKSSAKTKKGSYDFEAEIRSRLGSAMWTKPVSFWENGKLAFVIPIKSPEEEKEIESLLFFVMDSLSTDYFIYSREKALKVSELYGKDASGLWMFDYFTQHALNKQPISGIQYIKASSINTKKWVEWAPNCVDSYFGFGDLDEIYLGTHCWSTGGEWTGGGWDNTIGGDWHGNESGGNIGGSTDVGYGGSGGGTLGNMAPRAKEIFQNTDISDADWETLQKLLDPIIDECLGKFLSADLKILLSNQSIKIQFGYVDKTSGFNSATNTLTINASEGSDVLLHELIHIYQRFKNPNFSSYSLNDEIEARYIQYLYERSRKGYPSSKKERMYTYSNQLYMSIRLIENYVSNKGDLLPNITNQKISLYLQTGPVILLANLYPDFKFTENGSYFQNLNLLTIKC